jgi:hypothetical protein
MTVGDAVLVGCAVDSKVEGRSANYTSEVLEL